MLSLPATRVGHAQGAGITLPLIQRSPQGRSGSVRVGPTDAGVVISGRVAGPPPRWPASPDDMAQGDHVEVWIADPRLPEFPPVGWGNQFGYEQLNSEADCARRRDMEMGDTTAARREACQQWYRGQIRYRHVLRRLFVRQWQVAPNRAVEAFAVPAFQGLDSTARLAAAPLEPSGTPRGVFAPGPGGDGYTFELLVPWEALPPVRSLRVDRLRVMVDVFSPGAAPRRYGPFSTTASGRQWGDPTTFSTVPLPAARDYHLTPCQYQPVHPIIQHGADLAPLEASDSARVYFFPGPSLDLRQAIVLDNPAHGYQYQPDPESRSPVALVAQYWSKDLGAAETLCGPWLAYRSPAGVTRSDFLVDVTDSLETRRLANGDVLVKFGPRVFNSYFGSGQCGGCPRVALSWYYLDRTAGTVTEAFAYSGIAEFESSDVDIAIAPDWSELTVFEGRADPSTPDLLMKWTSVTSCFRAASHKFEECRRDARAVPPSPRHLNPVPY